MRYQAILMLLAVAGFCDAVSNNVITLAPWNFHEVVNGNRHVLVAFTADWCSHCQALYSHWDRVADTLAEHPEAGTVVGRVDAQAHNNLNLGFQIEGLPTILLFMRGSTKPAHQYDGERTTVAILKWLNDMLALPNPVEWKAPKMNVTVAPSEESLKRIEKLDTIISDHFKALDTDNDGFITVEDLLRSLKVEKVKDAETIAPKLFKTMDKNPKDGKVSLTEFIEEGQ